MSTLINFYNQLGAGPKSISINFINHLTAAGGDANFIILVPDFSEYKDLSTNQSNVHLIKLPKYNLLIMKGAFRLYLEFVLIPKLVWKYNVSSLLAFGNFLMSPVNIKKTVLLHHPYLFDDKLYKALRFKARLVEGLKRCVFALTLKNVDVVVVQSAYVKNAFSECWASYSKPVEVIPNPISDNFPLSVGTSFNSLVDLRFKNMKPLKLLYVSRFNPHKNHIFLLEVSKQLTAKGINHLIYVTLDSKIPGVIEFIGQAKLCNAHITNLGEVSQSSLDAYYKASHLFIFPSKSETFGNPMIESMKYGLPTIVPDLPYARAVMEGGGIYYCEDNVDDCVNGIREVIANHDVYRQASYRSSQQFQQFPTVSEWVSTYIKLVS